jgi:integrase
MLPRADLFFRFMAATGLRTCEAVSLTTKQVDPQRRGIWVRTAKWKKHPVRLVSLDPGTWALLDRRMAEWQLKPGAPLFWWAGKPITVRSAKHLFKRCAKLAGIRSCLAMHSLRHFHATVCVEAGLAPQEIAARLGHAGLDMVMQYFHLRESRQREIADNLGDRVFGAQTPEEQPPKAPRKAKKPPRRPKGKRKRRL